MKWDLPKGWKPGPLVFPEPERTLMIGDTTHDLQLAVNAGAACVAVSFGAHEHEAFAPFNPLFVAHSTRELHDWLVAHA